MKNKDFDSLGWDGLGRAAMDSDFLRTESNYQGYSGNKSRYCGYCNRKLKRSEKRFRNFLYEAVCEECDHYLRGEE